MNKSDSEKEAERGIQEFADNMAKRQAGFDKKWQEMLNEIKNHKHRSAKIKK